MRKGRIFGIIIILLGLSVLFSFPFLNIIFAILIIWLGTRIMNKSYNFDDYKGEIKVSGDNLNKVFVFSPINKTVVSDNFSGGKIVNVFAGGQIDFSGVKASKNVIELEITNVFAGVKIIVPKDWKIDLDEVNVVGGIEDKTKGDGKIVVKLKGSSIFGGMEITN